MNWAQNWLRIHQGTPFVIVTATNARRWKYRILVTKIIQNESLLYYNVFETRTLPGDGGAGESEKRSHNKLRLVIRSARGLSPSSSSSSRIIIF